MLKPGECHGYTSAPKAAAAHVLARRCLSRALPKRLQQHIFVQPEKECVVRIKLLPHWPFQQLNVAIPKLPQLRFNRALLRVCPCCSKPRLRKYSSSHRTTCLQETSARLPHSILPFIPGST